MQNSQQDSPSPYDGPVRCSFFGGPWADLTLYMEDDRDEWHIPHRLGIYLDKPVRRTEPTRFIRYVKRGIADDGTRLFYAEKQ